MSNQQLDQIPLTSLKGVGPALEKKFSQLGIYNVQDLLFHLPLRYEDRTRIDSIGRVSVGQQVQLQGEITGCNIQFGRRRSLHCVLRDNSGVISLRFFHFSAAQKKSLQAGAQLRCYGEVRRGRAGMELYHPEYKVLQDPDSEPIADSLTPIYPTTEGLQQGRLRNVARQALELLERSEQLRDYLPPQLVSSLGLQSLTDAIRHVHRPPIDAALNCLSGGVPGQKRFAFEELLAHRLCMRRFKNDSDKQTAPQLLADNELLTRYLRQLPFTLTNGQQTAYQEIASDLSSACPMLRLLQGDVGSGKTVVAALSALHAIGSDCQVALMAPTEILAEQHLLNFREWFEPLGINVGWLSGKTKGSERKQTLDSLSTGICQLLIGTHALFQDDVIYAGLGLIIIDEQHRFGVHQRLALRDKATTGDLNPHQLVMTATPIPRTLAMSAYADLDNSIIDELPPGRTPVNTAVVASNRRDEVIQRIDNACSEGNQAYWVCTLIEESETLQCQAAEATAEHLAQQLPHLSVGLIHGRMKSKQKLEVMERFKSGNLKLLVATTVIEVGVDVPNASLMVIENPERLGLAQLHQLRGRIGRGSVHSHCLLLYQTPLSESSKQRLAVMRESTDGFYIAEKDLELRGPGQVLGTQQTGLMTFRVADIGRDAGLLDEVRDASEIVLTQFPEIVDPLICRWLGDKVNYVNV
ncbi:MAG TPA: ATP-dependent DNA helicase RecG [Gammaproteobacteria bacterium]|jgi:ATP-dependent DNA helicase RecG|nr:ATP-dependent DNA helicase RecG [Gammaproteobacteria bacterium]HAJ77359.1 ATP-dependent DNA helicase RecG [Gammaproteobacteria bacterium]